MAHSRTGQGEHGKSLERPSVSESKGGRPQKAKGWGRSKGHRIQPKRAPNGQGWSHSGRNNVVLDDNPKYKIQTHESMLTYTNQNKDRVPD